MYKVMWQQKTPTRIAADGDLASRLATLQTLQAPGCFVALYGVPWFQSVSAHGVAVGVSDLHAD